MDADALRIFAFNILLIQYRLRGNCFRKIVLGKILERSFSLIRKQKFQRKTRNTETCHSGVKER